MTLIEAIDETLVVAAIRDAERRTRGEIRVHVNEAPAEGHFDVETAARAAFEQLGMAATAERNGVLIFIAVSARRFAVLGDAGIHARVGPDAWNAVANRLAERFREAAFTEGIQEAVERCGDLLAAHFPPDGRIDRDELPNAISRDRDESGA
jgi:uncharacterized membrane protein